MTSPPISHARATLHAAGISIEYVRAGCGDTLVLLQPAASDDAMVSPLLDSLARDHRVIAPVMPTDQTFPAALEGLLEGLGVEGAGLVATGMFRERAQEFVASHPGRVASLALL
jgi:pimeloyl-ACP methyl ester carboxylesterase